MITTEDFLQFWAEAIPYLRVVSCVDCLSNVFENAQVMHRSISLVGGAAAAWPLARVRSRRPCR